MRRFTGRLVAFVFVIAAFCLMVAPFALAQAGSKNADPAVPDITDDLGSWAAIIGILLPALVAILQKATWPSYINSLVFGAAVVVASVVYALIRFDDFTWAHWQGTFLAVLTWGIATYKTFWHPANRTDTVVSKLRAAGPIK
jgi:hypothetical protein